MGIKCPFFGRCGGCQYQNLSDEEYVCLKENFILNALRSQRIDASLSEMIRIGAHTRRRITLASQNGITGFNEAKSHKIIPIDTCPILLPKLEALLPKLQSLFADFPINANIAVLISEWGADINVKTQKEKKQYSQKKKTKPLTQDVLFLEAISTFCQENKVARFVFNSETLYQICSLPYPSNVFMQPSKEGEKTLIQLVLDGCKSAQKVLDLFCGLGTFTIPLHTNGKKVLGMDITEESIQSLQKQNIPAQARDLFRMPVLTSELNEYDAVVLDPARAGAKAQCEELAKSNVKRIVMVSCNPITFARDCRILTDAGYKIEKIIPVDQFIYSEHIEVVAYLNKAL